MQKCDTVSSCCSIISKFGFVRVCYIHSHVLCDHLPGIYLVILACMPTAVMYACWHWCSTYLFRMALETCLVNACRHTRCSCSFVCSLFIIITHMHCSLINARMLQNHMLSSKPNANDKVSIQAKGAVRGNNRIHARVPVARLGNNSMCTW